MTGTTRTETSSMTGSNGTASDRTALNESARTRQDQHDAAGTAGDAAASATLGAAQKISEEIRSTSAAAQQFNDSLESTAQRIRELNERAIAAAREAGQSSLDAYEKALQSFVSVEERMADATQLDSVKAVIGAQSEFIQSISGVYLNAARDMLN